MEAVCTAKRVLDAEIRGLQELSSCLDGNLELALNLLDREMGKVVVTGMGKSGHIARKIASTMSSLGTQALYLSAGDATHGDLGVIGPFDALLVLSKSGKTSEIQPCLDYARQRNVPIVSITENRYSLLGVASDIVLLLPKSSEACSLGVAPTTSTTMMLALGDALAVALMERHDFSRDDFHARHPGGNLGMTIGREN